MSGRFDVLQEPDYRRFVIGYFLSYILYWVTLLSMGWWMWQRTASASWVGIVSFCDLLPALFVTPVAAALADRGDRFRILKTVLWLQVSTGLTLSVVAATGALTPPLLAAFAFVEGTLVGIGQPAFFGLLNRLVSPKNLSAAVGVNVSAVQTSYILGPLLASYLFSFGIGIAPLAFAANALGTLGYLWFLSGITLREQPPKEPSPAPALLQEVIAGLTVFWTSPVAFRATVLVLAATVLQRPLTSLMPALNDWFGLFSPAYFPILTASLMTGGLLAGLIHARRNSEAGHEGITLRVFVGLIALYALLFLALGQFPGATALAIVGLFLTGLGCSYVMTGNITILQTRTPEHLRSRVLGNNLMLARATGALAVLCVGVLADAQGFVVAMISAALVAALVTPLALRRFRVAPA
jgi:MFS family permease